MLKQVNFFKWKSFKEAELYIDPLTVLIGTNASGKSNALDGLRFLNHAALGIDLASIFIGDTKLSGIRGGVEWSALKPFNRFTIETLVEGEEERTDYLYSISIETVPIVQLFAESLVRIKKRANSDKNPYKIRLFQTESVTSEKPSITARLYNEKNGTPLAMRRSSSLLSQLLSSSATLRKEIALGVESVAKVLQNIFILDPIPSQMRGYTALTNQLLTDASNISGVLAALPETHKLEIEQILAQYITELPERDIRRIWAEPVGKFKTDAMLYCEEVWLPNNEPTTIDARGMSDGTLRFLAILTALLTRPEHSQIVIEEIDNGLHPSRSHLLLKMLKELGSKRNVDVLATTHNPALLDELMPDFMPFVVVVHRDRQTGESQLTMLEDLENLPKLMSMGSLGKLATKGLLEDACA